MKLSKMRRKLNNKGMSLVEVIIAVVVLAAVVAPTMRLFTSSFSYNNTSRKNQRAITIAESAMESFKAYDLEDLCIQFGAGAAAASFKGVSYDGTTGRTVTAYNGGSVVSALDAEEKLNDDADRYEFNIYNAVEEGQYYDVKIKVTKKIGEEILELDTVNPYKDAVVQRPESDIDDVSIAVQQAALDDLATVSSPADMIAGGALSISNMQISSLNRTIHLKADHNGSGADIVTMEMTYDYVGTYDYQYVSTVDGTKTVSGTPFSGTISHEFDPATSMTTMTVYDNTSTISASGGKLENLYFYYYPLYADAIDAIAAKDIIVVDGATIPSDSDSKVQVFVSKQKATTYTDIELETYEPSYKVEVTGAGNVELYHNLDECLTGSGVTMQTPNISGFTEDEAVVSGAKEEKGLLYDVVIEVYNAGETDVLATFTGTMNN